MFHCIIYKSNLMPKKTYIYLNLKKRADFYYSIMQKAKKVDKTNVKAVFID